LGYSGLGVIVGVGVMVGVRILPVGVMVTSAVPCSWTVGAVVAVAGNGVGEGSGPGVMVLPPQAVRKIGIMIVKSRKIIFFHQLSLRSIPDGLIGSGDRLGMCTRRGRVNAPIVETSHLNLDSLFLCHIY